MTPSRRPDRQLFWLLAVALMLRLALFASAARDPARFQVEEDSAEYVRLGENLAAGRGFSQSTAPPYRPDVRRTPVYPSVVALAFLAPRARLHLAVVTGIVASVLTVVALYRMGALIFDPTAAWYAGLLLALDPTSAVYATQILTEPLFALLVLLSILPLLDTALTDRRAAVASGTLSGLAALCRPVAIGLAAALLPACFSRAAGQRARAMRVSVVVLAASTLLIGAWTARNYRVAHAATLTSLSATNMYLHRAAHIEARLSGRPVEEVRDAWVREFDARSAAWTERERIDWMDRHGRSFVLAHPVTYVVVAIAGIARMLSPDAIVLPRVLGVDIATTLWRTIYIATWGQLAIVYALAAYATVLWSRRRPRRIVLPLAVIAYFLVIGGPEMYPRFRVPLMPFFCLLAGAGLARDGR
jgi:4-amino-4-deoxy-L-arabinose transferase-like glycosyltransferase